MLEAKIGTAQNSSLKKKWLGVHFHCCQVYSRIYINAQDTAYEGRCPKCLKLVRVKIGTNGTNSRFFKAW